VNGKIQITPDPGKLYRYETRVVNGHIDEFESSTSKEALLIKASITNGNIQRH
jgi:hypothetical protein